MSVRMLSWGAEDTAHLLGSLLWILLDGSSLLGIVLHRLHDLSVGAVLRVRAKASGEAVSALAYSRIKGEQGMSLGFE